MVKTAQGLIREEILSLNPYIPGKQVKELEKELGMTGIIKLASNENPIGPSAKAKQAAGKVLAECNLYPDSHCSQLRQSLAEHLQVSEDNLVFGNGAHELIYLLTTAFITPGEEAVVPVPTFGAYAAAVKLAGGIVRQVPLKGFNIDLEGCLTAINERTKLVFICTPNNPTGTIVNGAALQNFLARVPAHVLVILDEAYGEYVDSAEHIDGLEFVNSGHNVVVLRTFSKIYALAGLRVGYAIANTELAGYLDRVRQVFNVDSIAQAAAVASLEDTEHFLNSLQINKQGKEYLYRALAEMDLEYVPTQANFLLVNVRGDATEVFEELLHMGVMVRPASIYNLPRYLRVTIGTLEQNKKFIAALSRVMAFLEFDQYVIGGN